MSGIKGKVGDRTSKQQFSSNIDYLSPTSTQKFLGCSHYCCVALA
ncbi:hypothetical protein [Oscillatoria sp. FACHB-1407]